MGQKVCPIGQRIGISHEWSSFWYGSKQEFGDMVVEDFRIREFLKKKPSCVGASFFTIKRMSGKVEVTIHTARPGLAIGKKGAEIDQIKQDLHKLTGKEVWVEVGEIKRPDNDAKLLAENIARQLERRIAFRRAMKRGLQSCIDSGALGVKIQVSGRLGGAEIARTEWYKEGRIPLHTLRAKIDYATAEAKTTYGIIGVKVWVNQGEEKSPKKNAS